MNTPVDFTTAKLLKEKGFDESVVNVYSAIFAKLTNITTRTKVNNTLQTAAPTIAEVVTWLYEKYGIWVEVNFLPNMGKFSFISKPIDFKKPKEFLSYKEYYDATAKFVSKEKFNSPTEAYEVAIEYTLKNLI